MSLDLFINVVVTTEVGSRFVYELFLIITCDSCFNEIMRNESIILLNVKQTYMTFKKYLNILEIEWNS